MDTFAIGELLVSPVATLERLAGSNPASLLATGLPGLEAQGGFPSNVPYLQHGAWWALFNKVGSKRIVTLKELQLIPLQSRTGSTFSNYTTQHISAITGGTEVVPVPLDTNNASLSPLIVARTNCDIVPVVNSTLRVTMDLPLLNATRAVPYPVWRSPTSGNSEIFTQVNTETQGIVLNANEGLSVMSTGGVSRENCSLALSVYFSVDAETFVIREPIQTGSMPSLFALFNGPSGKVVIIHRLVVSEITSDETTLRRLSFETISGIHPNSLGTSVDLVPLDSTAESLPPQIVCCTKAGVLQSSADAVNVIRDDRNFLRRQVGAIMGAGPGLNTGPNVGGNAISPDYCRIWRGDMILREGEGVALFQKDDTSSYGNGYWLFGLITVENAAVPGYSNASVSYVS